MNLNEHFSQLTTRGKRLMARGKHLVRATADELRAPNHAHRTRHALRLAMTQLALVAVLAAACIPAFAATGTPTFSLGALSDLAWNYARVSISFNSNGAQYSNLPSDSERPMITVQYENQIDGVLLNSVTLPEDVGTRTTLFPLNNLIAETNYAYRAMMTYNGTTQYTNWQTFRTPEQNSLFSSSSNQQQNYYYGSPTIILSGISGILQGEAIATVSYNLNGATYSDNTNPHVSASYTNTATGVQYSTALISVSQQSGTTTLRLPNLDPNTKYSVQGILTFNGSPLVTAPQTFTTLAKGVYPTVSVDDSVVSSNNAGNASSNSGLTIGTPTLGSVTAALGLNKTTSTLESIVKTGGYGTKNGVSLGITDSHARVVSGDDFDYTIQYYNANSASLKLARTTVALPDQYTFRGGDSNTVYSESSNVVTIYLGTIAGKESGTLTFKARALEGTDQGVVTKANLAYTGGSVSAQDSDTYVGGQESVLGATVFGKGFFPQTFFGWLVVIIILILLMIVGRRYLQPPVKAEEKKDK